MISLEALFHNYHCTRVNHNYQPIQQICLDKKCQQDMKLMCDRCSDLHNGCRTSNPWQLDNRFRQQQENFFQIPPQDITQNFNLVKKKIIDILDRISVEINQILAPKIPGLIDAYNQLCNPDNKPTEMNQIIKEYQQQLMTLVFQEQNMRVQQPLKIIKAYIDKFNEWLEGMPRLKFEPIQDIICREPQEEFGAPTYISIKDMVQSFKVNSTCKLISLCHGRIKNNSANIENSVPDMDLHIKIFKSTDLRNNPIYDNRITGSQKLNQHIFNSNLEFPVYLEAGQLYTIVSNLNKKLLMGDFRQDTISNGILITSHSPEIKYFFPIDMNPKRRNHIAGFCFEHLM